MASTTFKFKFQRVLDLREQQQQSLEGKLAAVQEDIRCAEATVERWLRVRRETLEEQGRARRKGRLELEASYGQYLGFVREKLSESRELLATLCGRREQLRHELEELLKACKLLEKYRDRLRDEFREELTREEQKLLDMHSIYKHRQGGEER